MTTHSRMIEAPIAQALSKIFDTASAEKGATIDANVTGMTITVKRRLSPKYVVNVATDGQHLTITDDQSNPSSMKLAWTLVRAVDDLVDDRGLSAAGNDASKSERQACDRETILNHLRPDDFVRFVTTAWDDGSFYAVIVTDTHIRMVKIGVISSGTKEIAIPSITSIDAKSKMVTDELKLTVSNGEIELSKMPKGRASAMADVVRDLMADAPSDGRSTPVGGAADELSKLAELHAAGVLTDQEFAAAKARALGL